MLFWEARRQEKCVFSANKQKGSLCKDDIRTKLYIWQNWHQHVVALFQMALTASMALRYTLAQSTSRQIIAVICAVWHLIWHASSRLAITYHSSRNPGRHCNYTVLPRALPVWPTTISQYLCPACARYRFGGSVPKLPQLEQNKNCSARPILAVNPTPPLHAT